MKPSIAFEQHRETIRRLVHEAGMTNPRLFGSVLHGDDLEGSDIDLLVDPAPDTSLLDLSKLKLLLEEAVGLQIDLLTPRFLPEEFREEVVREAALV